MHQVLEEPVVSVERKPLASTRARRFTKSSLLWMILTALALRLAVMAFLLPEQLDPFRDHWRFGYEAGRVARSIAQGHGFGSPLYEVTGPTAWFTPLFPYLLAGVFKVFGVYSRASALVMLGLNCLLSALTCIPVFFIARRSFGDRPARWAGWLWAFFPYGIYFPAERIWETWLATLLLCLIFLLALKLAESPSLSSWAGYGLLWAIAALNSPVALSVLPFLTAWICYRLQWRRKTWFVPSVVSAVVFVAVVSPWFVRNYETFHQFVPFRDTFGLELHVGNNADTSHWHPNAAGPWHNDDEYAEYKQMGELGYMARKKQQALEFISLHPGEFAWMTLRRAGYLWTGFWSFDRNYLQQEPLDLANIPFTTAFTVLALLGLRRAFQKDASSAMPYAIVLVFFPVVYFVTHPEVYYLRPLDPIVAILAASLMQPRGKNSEKLETVGLEELETVDFEQVQA
jgi:4-amino-4-deoxy-L-arabinose transferase-like glycosyltransferase